MARLEELTRGARVKGLLPGISVTIVDVQWHGASAVELTFKDLDGRPGNQLLFRDDEARLEIAAEGQPWRFDADARLLRLVSEAQRIRLAYLFDPYLAVHTSQVQPLPHQITAVYEKMLPRQPLRFLLADDPGAGKTIMAGLYIKELIARGDLARCLIVCPGSLVEQWQEELDRRFQLPFDILTNDRLEAARSGNAFTEIPLVIARLDKLARNPDLVEKVTQVDWDLIVVDEAHKMSATFFGGEVKYTKRYRLGQALAEATRNFLLMTATPHNGKEEDFQLFMALLDGDRFEGRFRDGVHTVDVSDMMRRMVKEKLVKFDARPLFPERRAYTVPYKLSDQEARLYHEVTTYVREEFNRAEALHSNGRMGTVGFALTVLQRRLASSPEAIYQSLRRRRERLERRQREAELLARGAGLAAPSFAQPLPGDEDEGLDDYLDEIPAEELEALEEEVVDEASAARTVAELRLEIDLLRRLEGLAQAVRASGTDRKWEELSRLLQDQEAMFDSTSHDAANPRGRRRKLVIFTEHRDTLSYLSEDIRTLLGRAEAVVTIHGGMLREERRKAQEAFTQDKDTVVLVATDAAGEGINLQRAHLMINYDLPWNPNRLEQRFGRIHRIGQTEVCHLWNLVADETREGDVYQTLLRKLEKERATLGGAVFDVIGQAIAGAELRRLMIEAIRYGDRPEVRARLMQQVEGALDPQRLTDLIEEHALAADTMDISQVRAIREDMERWEARRLQPHYIASFFKAAFHHLGGTLRERETGRFEITHVPALIRQRDRLVGRREPVMPRYERACFDKELINVAGKPSPAAFLCPGHPLLDAVIDLVLERYRGLMKQGAILKDKASAGEEVRALFYLEHSIQDARVVEGGQRRTVSKRLQFVEMNLSTGEFRDAGAAPYLDYEPLAADEQALLAPVVEPLLADRTMESQAVSYAISAVVPRHLREVRSIREPLIDKTTAAVKERLTKEIAHWDHRAMELAIQERAGRTNARINSAKARQRADELQARLTKRMAELQQERQLAALPPTVIGGALIVPQGLLDRLAGQRSSPPSLFARETKRVELAAMAAVMQVERELGYDPKDVGRDNLGYDVESGDRQAEHAGNDPRRLRFIEVKGRIRGADTVTLTRNEILCALNKPDDWLLALVEVPPVEELPADVQAGLLRDDRELYVTAVGCQVRYLRRPFQKEPDFDAVSVNYDLQRLRALGAAPH
ncbi:MAG: helicase-related protein [Anaerolineae bacterium]